MTRDKTRIYCMMHQALDDSDQTRKYGISESILQALIMTLLQTMSYHCASKLILIIINIIIDVKHIRSCYYVL